DGFGDALTKRNGDVVGVERAGCRKERRAALVLLADDQRPVRPVVKRLAKLRLDQRTLFFDDDDGLQPPGELLHMLVVERPWTGDLEQADAQTVGLGLIDAKIVKRLTHVEIALADGGDAK